jgi:hypothetical protein
MFGWVGFWAIEISGSNRSRTKILDFGQMQFCDMIQWFKLKLIENNN